MILAAPLVTRDASGALYISDGRDTLYTTPIAPKPPDAFSGFQVRVLDGVPDLLALAA